MAQIAWLGKKSPFCGNVTYGLSTTESLRCRGHAVHFIHFDTPAAPLGAPLGRADGGSPQAVALRAGATEQEPEVTLTYLVKSQVYTIPSPGAQRELRESLERIRPDLVHASLTLSPLDFRLPDLCQQLGLPLVLAGAVVSRYGLLPVLWGLAAIALLTALLEQPWRRC